MKNNNNLWLLKKVIYWLCFILIFSSAVFAKEQRIYQTDRFGNIQYNKPSYTIQENGRIVETDRFGNKQYQNGRYQIKADKIQAVDRFGNVQPNKPGFSIKK